MFVFPTLTYCGFSAKLLCPEQDSRCLCRDQPPEGRPRFLQALASLDLRGISKAGFAGAGCLPSSGGVRLKEPELYFYLLLILSRLAEVCLWHTKEEPAPCKARVTLLGRGV